MLVLVVPLGGLALATHTAYVNAEPESDVNAPRTSHTITAYASAPGVEINFNIECDASDSTREPDTDPTTTDPTCTSANTNSDETLPTNRTTSDDECVTGASPDPTDPATPDGYSCSITYTDAGSDGTSHTDYIRVWSDEGTNDDTYQPGEPNDVVTKTWENNPILDCEPEAANNPTTGPESSHTITCTVTSPANNGARLAGARVHFENETTGVNDPDNTDNSTSSPDKTCTTDQNGQCPVTFESEGQTGTAVIRAWVDTGAAGGNDADETEGPNAGNTGEAGAHPGTNATPGAKPEPDNTDVVTKSWAPPNAVQALPETDRNPVNTEHTVFAYTDQPNVEVNFNIESGPNSNDDALNPTEQTTSDYECVTGGSPDPNDPGEPNRYSCSWTYVGAGGEGTDNIRVWVDTGSGSSGNDDEYQVGEPNDFVQKTWYEQDAARAVLNCEPETATNPTIGPESSHEITCTVLDQEGRPFLDATVYFENESPRVNDPDDNANRTNPDNTCTTSDEANSEGKCSVTYPSENQAGNATIRAWVDEDGDEATDDSDAGETQAQEDSDGTDVVSKTWEAVRIDASPEEDRNPVGARHTVIATTGDPGVEVNFNIEEGPHEDPPAAVTGEQTTSDFECVTDSNPEGGYSCSWTYTGRAEGTDTIRVWFDEGTDNDDEYQEGEPNDVVTKTWYRQDVAQARLDCEPETGTNPSDGEGSDHTITCTVRDQENNPFFGARVHFENESPNVNDPDNNADRTNPDKTCTTPAAPEGNGQCSVTYTSEAQVGIATIRAWVDRDNNPSTDNADGAETQAENDTDGTDVVTKTWTGDARAIDCAPDTGVNPVGTDHVVTCTVLDAGGQPVQGEDVTFTSSGPGSVSPTGGRTDANGRVSTTARSQQPGEQTITGTITDDVTGNEPSHVDECDRAANSPQGAPAGKCSDSVKKTWEPATQPACSDQRDNDGDGKVDHPADPGCSSPQDTDESDVAPPACSDGIDNDGDGKVDHPTDPGCASAQDTDEADQPVVERGPCSGYPQNSSTPIQGGTGNVVVGSPEDDLLTGTDGDDIICALGGDDVVDALGGKDQVVGNAGNDALSGRQGNDVVDGGVGNDSLKGNAGIDTLRGRGGDDTLQGGSGEDTAFGGAGNDAMRGYNQNDTLMGGKGRDVAKGGRGRKDICRAETETGCERN